VVNRPPCVDWLVWMGAAGSDLKPSEDTCKVRETLTAEHAHHMALAVLVISSDVPPLISEYWVRAPAQTLHAGSTALLVVQIQVRTGAPEHHQRVGASDRHRICSAFNWAVTASTLSELSFAPGPGLRKAVA
jgi:hypothetical protein